MKYAMLAVTAERQEQYAADRLPLYEQDEQQDTDIIDLQSAISELACKVCINRPLKRPRT